MLSEKQKEVIRENFDVEKEKCCKEHHIFYSRLAVEPLLGEYNRSYFRTMIRDWKYEF